VQVNGAPLTPGYVMMDIMPERGLYYLDGTTIKHICPRLGIKATSSSSYTFYSELSDTTYDQNWDDVRFLQQVDTAELSMKNEDYFSEVFFFKNAYTPLTPNNKNFVKYEIERQGIFSMQTMRAFQSVIPHPYFASTTNSVCEVLSISINISASKATTKFIYKSIAL
jgi:hypothetical protein